ncbi:MAG: PAS domain S-box protein [Bryobacteraceae bacterium]
MTTVGLFSHPWLFLLAVVFGTAGGFVCGRICGRWTARRKLGDQEKYLAAVLRSIGDGVIVCDREARIRIMNPVAEQLCGWPGAEAVGRNLEEIFRIVNAESRALAPNPVPKALQMAVATGLANDTLLLSRDGREIPIADSCAPILGSGGRVEGAVLVFRDVTESYRQRKLLEESEQRYRLLFENAVSALAVHQLVRDTGGRVVDTVVLSVNCRCEAETGLSREEVLGKRFSQWYPYGEAGRQPWLERFAAVERTGEAMTVEETVDPINRRMLVQIWRVAPDTVGVALMDVTRIRQAEAEAARLGRLLEASQNEIYIFDAETLRFEQASRSALEQLQYTLDELRQLTPLDLKPELNRASFERLLAPLRAGAERRIRFQTLHRRKDGSTYPVDVRLELIGEAGRRYYLAVIEDITARLEAELQMKAVFESAMVGLAVVSASDGRLLRWNAAFSELLGWKRDENRMQGLQHLPTLATGANALPDWFDRCLTEAVRVGHAASEGQFVSSGGRQVWCSVRLSRIDLPGASEVLCVVHDLTERKLAELRLAESEQRYRAIVEHSADLVWTVTPDGRISYASPSWARITGHQPETMQGRWIRDGIHPEDWPAAWRVLQDLVDGRKAEASLAYRVLHADGSWRWHEGRGMAVRQPGGKVSVIVGVSRDVTDRKAAEQMLASKMRELEESRQAERERAAQLERLMRELEAEKARAELASLAKSTFLARMSHEMRTPLNAIIGMGQLLREQVSDSGLTEQADVMLSSARNLLHLIEELLDLSAIEAGRLSLQIAPFDVEELLDSVASEAAVMAGHKRLELLFWVGKEVPRELSGDLRRLRQILLNLVSNSIKYTSRGQVRVRLSWQPQDGDSEKGLLELQVEDTGPGIPVDKIPLVFERFSRLEQAGANLKEGTGLGLSIVKELTELMGGEVTVSSLVGQGSTFTVKIPLSVVDTPGLVEAGLDSVLPTKTLILTADKARAACASALLSRLGADPIVFDSPARAIAWCRLRDTLSGSDALLVWEGEFSPEEAVQLAGLLCRSPNDALRLYLVDDIGSSLEQARGDYIRLPRALSPAVFRRLWTQPQPKTATAERVNHGATTNSQSQSGPKHRSRVLVAEDNLLNQRVIAGLLGRLGVDCDLVTNGRDAVQRLEQNRYDLVFLDLSMPEMDGLAAARLIRDLESRRNAQPTPIIALTAHAYEDDKRRCFEAGMQDFLAKPVSLTELAAMLDRWLPQTVESAPRAVKATKTSNAAGSLKYDDTDNSTQVRDGAEPLTESEPD